MKQQEEQNIGLCVQKQITDEVIKRNPVIEERLKYEAIRLSPAYQCFVCEGYNYNCEQYKVEGK